MTQLSKLSFHRDPKAFRINETAGHSYFIPFANPEDTANAREESAFFTPLCGSW